MKRKLMAMLLVLCMVLTILPVAALADEAGIEPAVVPMTELKEATPVEESDSVPMMDLKEATPVEQTDSVPMADLEEAQPTEQPEGEHMMLLTAAETVTDPVAKIGETGYETLAEAVTAANNGAEVIVQKTLNDLEPIEITNGKDLTLNLNGFDLNFKTAKAFVVNHGKLNLTGTGTITAQYAGHYNSALDLTGSAQDVPDYSVVIIGENVTVKSNGSFGGAIFQEGNTGKAYGAKLIVNGTFESTYGFSINGLVKATTGTNLPEVLVNPTGKIVGSSAIYGAGYGNYNIYGTLIGNEEFGIEVRAGNLNVYPGAVITCSAPFSDPVPNGNGSTVTGAAIAVSQHTTNLPIHVNIQGGTITETGKNGHAFYEIDTVKNENPADVAKDVTINVTGGTFNGGVVSTNKTNFISGGTFTTKPADEFFAEGKAPVQKPDGSYGVIDATDKDVEAANAVNALIDQLPAPDQVKLTDANQINAAKVAYDALAKKELVDQEHTNKLNAVVAKLAELKKADADQRAADEVIAKINALPALKDISLRDKADVVAARNAYNALTPDQKNLVPNETLIKLKAAEDAISWLEHYFTSNITVKSSLHGWVSVNRTYAAKGDLVTITVYPDKGYKLDWLTVKDYFGDKVTVYEDRYNKDVYTFYMPSTAVTVEAGFKSVDHVDFYDVDYRDYYYDAVRWAVDNGITTGVSAYYFEPDRVCTRAEAVTFLWRAAGSPRPWHYNNSFKDVAYNDYYYDAVQWAVEQGIVKGTSETTFSPNAVCDRGQIVTLLWRANGSRYNYSTNPFRDVTTSDYFYDAVQWAVWNDITTGVTYDTFAPADPCTRGQIVTFLYRSEN